MYHVGYDYVKPKYGEKAKLCYIDTDSFIVYIKSDDIYKDIARDAETRSDTSNYELKCNSIERSLPKGKNKKVIRLMKNELDGKIMTKLAELRAKTYSYLMMMVVKIQKQKPQKRVSEKQNLNLKITKTVLKQHTLKIK